jgi:hypothetical protein
MTSLPHILSISIFPGGRGGGVPESLEILLDIIGAWSRYHSADLKCKYLYTVIVSYFHDVLERNCMVDKIAVSLSYYS